MKIESLLNSYFINLAPLCLRKDENFYHNPLTPRWIENMKDLMYFLAMDYDHFIVNDQLYVLSSLNNQIITLLENFLDADKVFEILNSFYDLDSYELTNGSIFYQKAPLKDFYLTNPKHSEYFTLSLWMFFLHKDLTYLLKHFMLTNSLSHKLYVLDRVQWT